MARKVGDEDTHKQLSGSYSRHLNTPIYIRNGLWLFLSVLWGIFGFVMWIPYLLRNCAVFLVRVAHASMTGDRFWKAEDRLRRSARFYPKGFARISVLKEDYPDARSRQSGPLENSEASAQPYWIAAELAWAILFWLGIWTLAFGPPDFLSRLWIVPGLWGSILP